MRSTRKKALLAAPLAALALLTLAACGGSTEDSKDGGKDGAGKPGVKPAATVSVRTADSSLGKILVDDSGRTLYGFTKDKAGASKCDADCIAVWPALTSAKDVKAGAGTDAALLKETKLGEGAEQAVYGDWPLYYYVGDATAGDVNGQGLDGEWFVIAADGKLIKKPA